MSSRHLTGSGSALLAYFALAFGISWIGVGLIAARTGLPAPPDAAPANRIHVLLAMLAGPALASLGLTAVIDRRRGLRALAECLGRWRIGAGWYAAAGFVPALLLAILGALSFVSPSFTPGLLTSESPATVVVLALIAGVGSGLFEELGWTGFATPRLLSRLGWRRSGTVLGIVWGLWHVLPDFWGGTSYGSLWALHMIEWLVALTAFRILMTWAYDRTGSLLLAMLLHASSTGAQVLLWPSAASPQAELLWYGLFAATLAIAVGSVVVYERASWRISHAGHAPRRTSC